MVNQSRATEAFYSRRQYRLTDALKKKSPGGNLKPLGEIVRYRAGRELCPDVLSGEAAAEATASASRHP